MIFQPQQRRADLYHRLLTSTLLVRSQTPTGERGHSFVYAAADAVVRDRGDDEQFVDEACAFRDEMRAHLKLAGPPSVVPPNGGAKAVAEAVELMWATGRFRTILFEGYIADSAREHAPRFEALDATFSARGAIVLRADGATADRWNDKSNFVDFMTELHGPEATPRGSTMAAEDAGTVIAATRAHLEPSGRAILKAPGMGGIGNLIVEAADPAPLDQKVSAFLANLTPSTRLRVEAWEPWRRTLGCSFFVTEDATPIPIEVCEQSVSGASAGFIGGTSMTGLTEADRTALQAWLAPFVSRAASEGMRGFLGVDVILSDSRGRAGECCLPDCGLVARFVEANMRVNAQNQDRLFVAQLAHRDGRDMDRIHHLKTGVYVAESTSRRESIGLIDAALAGVSRSFSGAAHLGQLQHVVVECYGRHAASRNDFVLFVGEDVPASTFSDAVGRLRRRGWVKG